jgi:hypothetical protein
MSLYQSICELRRGNHRRHPSPAKHGRRLVVEALEGRALLTTLFQGGGQGVGKSSAVVGLLDLDAGGHAKSSAVAAIATIDTAAKAATGVGSEVQRDGIMAGWVTSTVNVSASAGGGGAGRALVSGMAGTGGSGAGKFSSSVGLFPGCPGCW